MKKLVPVLFVLLNAIQLAGQSHLPAQVKYFVEKRDLQPLTSIDTLSPNRPVNTVTQMGWHIDYYVQTVANDGPEQWNVYALIYNDSILHTLSATESAKAPHYTGYTILKETRDCIYLVNGRSDPNSALTVVSK